MKAIQTNAVERSRRAGKSLPETDTHQHGWKRALSALFSPAYRLHHYRNIRAQMLGDALRRLDCCQ